MANITVLNGTMEQKEIDQYVNLILKDNPTRKLDNLELSIDGDFLSLNLSNE